MAGLVRERNLTFLAASVAYYAFVSLIPLLLLALVVGSAVGGRAFTDRIVVLTGQYLSGSGQELIVGALTDAQSRVGASVVSLVALGWSGLKLFRGLDIAFDEVYGDEQHPGLVEQVRDALVVVVAVAGAAVLVVAVALALRLLDLQLPYVNLLGSLALVAVLVVAFLPLYYVLPPDDVTVWEALPGTLVAAVGWVLLQLGFRLYAANAGSYEAYGYIGGVLLFVTWLYFASIVILLGAAVNAVRHRNLTPGLTA